MDRVTFSERVENGSILRFSILPARRGSTSVTYSVVVYADAPGATEEREVFSTNVSFVRIDAKGNKTPLPDTPVLRSEKGRIG
jgi:acyl-CoA hydrolase